MSIGYKKLAELIDIEVDSMTKLPTKHKELLAELCKKVYMIESSTESMSSQRLIDEMTGEIGNAADKFKDE